MSANQIHMKEEFFRFAETISVKGVSRILKAKNKVYRVLWSIAVLTSLCILLWQLSTVFVAYFTWPVTTLVEESREKPPFPDVTICNLYPTYSLESMSERFRWSRYLTVLKKPMTNSFEEFHIETNLSEEYYYGLLQYLYSRTGYFTNFPIIDKYFEFDDQLIQTYEAYNWQWRKNNYKTCECTGKFHWDPNYYACRTLNIPEECQGRIRGMALILYIHNFPEVLQMLILNGQTDLGAQDTGVLVAIHAPGTTPNFKIANSVGPGTDNKIRLSPVIRSRLPSPYSDCTNQKYIKSQTDITQKKLLYTKDVCIDVCLQQQVLDKCGCLSIAFQFTPEQQYIANGIICGNLSFLENMTKGMKDYLCSLTTPLDQDSCEDECKNPCDEVSYDFTISSAPWPHVSTQLLFAEALNVFNSTYAWKFDIYKNILNKYKNTENSFETIRQLEKVDLIEKNFLQLSIFFEGYGAFVMKDVPSLTSDKMLAMIGGGLSLWLGISIMTLVEVLEFLCTLIHLYIQEKKIAESPAVGMNVHAATN